MFDSHEKRALKQQIQDLQAELQQINSASAQALSDYQASLADKWEYRTEDDITPARLAEYGAHGWELASAYSFINGSGPGLLGNQIYNITVRYIFKRVVHEVPASLKASIDAQYSTLTIEAQIAGLQEQLGAMK